jgi:hypothetical protein
LKQLCGSIDFIAVSSGAASGRLFYKEKEKKSVANAEKAVKLLI